MKPEILREAMVDFINHAEIDMWRFSFTQLAAVSGAALTVIFGSMAYQMGGNAQAKHGLSPRDLRNPDHALCVNADKPVYFTARNAKKYEVSCR